jgi:hypothetical protein
VSVRALVTQWFDSLEIHTIQASAALSRRSFFCRGGNIEKKEHFPGNVLRGHLYVYFDHGYS